MPSRSNSMIRHDFNRLNELVASHSGDVNELATIADMVLSATEKVNAAWQDFQATAVTGDNV